MRKEQGKQIDAKRLLWKAIQKNWMCRWRQRPRPEVEWSSQTLFLFWRAGTCDISLMLKCFQIYSDVNNLWSVTWPFLQILLHFHPFILACVRPSQTWHFNFSQYFGGLNHVDHTFSECTSSRLTIFATLTTAPQEPSGPPEPPWLSWPPWPLVTPWPHRLTIQLRPPGPPCPRGRPEPPCPLVWNL